MSTEEPAWKAELRQQITEALARADGHRWIHITDARRAVLTEAYAAKVDALLPHVQAAEERGRREALRKAAEDLRDVVGRQDYEGEDERVKRFVAGWRQAADHIDPDKEKA